MALMEFWELMSYVVTVVGLPLAIVVFTVEQRKQRANEDVEIQQILSDSYTDFLKIVLQHPDLKLLVSERTPDRTDEDRDRVRAIFSILISLFERAFILTYEKRRTHCKRRYWQSWEDIMREWCQREDFRRMLPDLLVGEDAEFAAYITGLAKKIAPAG